MAGIWGHWSRFPLSKFLYIGCTGAEWSNSSLLRRPQTFKWSWVSVSHWLPISYCLFLFPFCFFLSTWFLSISLCLCLSVCLSVSLSLSLSLRDFKVCCRCSFEITDVRDFPGGTVNRNSPANAEECSIPGPAGSYMPRNNRAHAPQLLKPTCSRAHAPQQEKPPQWEGWAPKLERSPHSPQLEKVCRQQGKTQHNQNKLNK